MSLIDNLNQLETSLLDAKALLASNLNEKGVTASSGDTLTQLANSVNDIPSGGDLDFSTIGYTSTPQYLKDGLAYSQEIYNNWNPSTTTLQDRFRDDTQLVYLPAIEASNVKNMVKMCDNSTVQFVPSNLNTINVKTIQSAFYKCKALTQIDLSGWDLSKINSSQYTFASCHTLQSVKLPKGFGANNTNMSSMFAYCYTLKEINTEDIITDNVTSMNQLFYQCSGLTSLDLSSWNTSNVKDMGNLVAECVNLKTLNLTNWNTSKVTTWHSSIYGMCYECQKLKRIDGYLDYTSTVKNGSGNIYTWQRADNLRRVEIRNIGKPSGCSELYLAITYWGVNTDEIPDARQSLIDSLITYSFDRAAAGYSACKLNLSSTTKALLTEDEIAQITAKGYTIA